MDVRSVTIYGNRMNNQKEHALANSFLNIGKKGQTVEGVIGAVSGQITLNFNGISVSVAKNAVKNPVEGDVRSFRIMDISKDSIVLKEVDRRPETGDAGDRMSAGAVPNGYGFSDYLEKSAKEAAGTLDEGEKLAVLSGEDYQEIEEEEGSLEKMTKEVVESAIEKGKARRNWQQQKLEENQEFRKKLQEDLEKMQLAGFLDQKSEGQIRQAMEDAGIPVTEENLSQVVSALSMSYSALEMTDQSKAYIVGQNLSPTIDHLYQGKFSVFGAVGSSGPGQNYGDYQKQIEQILTNCGYDTPEGRESARWLFDRELPINQVTLSKLETLEQIPQNMTGDKVLEQILFAMSAGLSPKEAVLDDSQFVVAREAVKDFQQIDDSTIIHVVDYLKEHPQMISVGAEAEAWDAAAGQEDAQENRGFVNLELIREIQDKVRISGGGQVETVPMVYGKDMSEDEIAQVTLKRQVEEIRQKMTLQSAVRMAQKGIQVETASLNQIISELRQQEQNYYSGQVGARMEDIPAGQFDLLQETLSKTDDIANAHASILGTRVRQQELLTVNELHKAVSSQVAGRQEWNGVYEAVSTRARKDLGDSIQKAFQSVPEILSDMGLEDTQANERAVRILGYNSMEITEENINQVKVFDSKVNQLIDNMKPATVLELIRQGENTLVMPIDELNEKLKQINEEKGIDDHEKYSRFLWQLEKSHQITEDERAGYIGVYRLLHQVEQSDGAVIGALMGAKQELTLGNLLTQARIRKIKGIDSIVDDNAGIREIARTKETITEQIERGISGQDRRDGREMEGQASQARYYQNLVEESLQELTPEKLSSITDGDMEKLLDVSVEKFFEQLKNAPENQEVKKEYYEMLASEVREQMQSSTEAQEYLGKLGISDTVGNIIAMQTVLEGQQSVYGEAYKRRDVLPRKERQELEDVVDSMEDALGEEAALREKCEQSEKIMQDILTKSYEQADISFEDLQTLRQLGRGIRLQGAMRQSRSYDIPIRTGDTITSLNLTIIHGADESGRIQVSMEDGDCGNISLDFKLSGGAVKGFVLCDERRGFEALKDGEEILKENIEHAGFQVRNISFGMDFKSRNELLNSQIETQEADTAHLYQISKMLVRYVRSAIENGGIS